MVDTSTYAKQEDISEEGEAWRASTPPTQVDPVRDALEAVKIESKSAARVMVPKNAVPVVSRDAEQALRFVAVLDDHEGVQNVSANFDVSDVETTRISGA